MLSMILPSGKAMICEELYKNCPIRLYEYEFLADLCRFELMDFGSFWGHFGDVLVSQISSSNRLSKIKNTLKGRMGRKWCIMARDLERE